MKTTRIASPIASILACSLLAACGGGGGMVRPTVAAPPPPTSPPPPATPATLCSMPLTGDCVVISPSKGFSLALPGGRESDHSLVVGKDGTHFTDLRLDLGDDSRFSGGTVIQNGFLFLSTGSDYTPATTHELGTTLRSNVTVFSTGQLMVGSGGRTHGGILVGDLTNHGFATVSEHGRVTGNVSNFGTLFQQGTIDGNVQNSGVVRAGGIYSTNVINGDFKQSVSGELAVGLPNSDLAYSMGYESTLRVLGAAILEGGTLSLRADPINLGWGETAPFPLPAAPITAHILHADGGVFGSFDRWTSPGLFIEGGLRYGSNDVWFDLTRVSVQAAMAGQGFGGITLASAGNLDRALASADGFAAAPNATQSRFLRSAGRLLWLDDAAQAARSLDSLAGSLHVDAMQALAQDDALARGIGARTLALQPGMDAGAWSQLKGGNTIAGIDQWLSPRWLVGATAAQTRDVRNDAFGGHSQHDSPQAAVYLRWFGNDGWYAGGSAGYAQHALSLDRRIDLADGRHWNAHAQRQLGIASFDAEAGRRFAFNDVTIAPYVWLGADALRSERSLEQGLTGFELALQANTQASLDAGLGLRVGKQWRFGETGWLALDADARYRQRLMRSGDPLRAAFIGVPDLWFDVPGHEARNGTWLELGLRGGFGRGWAWSLGHAGSLAGQANGRNWQVGLARRF